VCNFSLLTVVLADLCDLEMWRMEHEFEVVGSSRHVLVFVFTSVAIACNKWLITSSEQLSSKRCWERDDLSSSKSPIYHCMTGNMVHLSEQGTLCNFYFSCSVASVINRFIVWLVLHCWHYCLNFCSLLQMKSQNFNMTSSHI
jgi:hypothetical protein